MHGHGHRGSRFISIASARARACTRYRFMHFQNLNLWGRYVCCGRIQSAGCVWWARDATDAHAPSCAAAPASSASRSPCAAALLGTQLSSHLGMNAALPRCSVTEMAHGVSAGRWSKRPPWSMSLRNRQGQPQAPRARRAASLAARSCTLRRAGARRHALPACRTSKATATSMPAGMMARSLCPHICTGTPAGHSARPAR